MAFAFGFPRDTTALIESLWDWRYCLVRAGGKTPSASAMPLPVPGHAYYVNTSNMEHGQYYIQRIEGFDAPQTLLGRSQAPTYAMINIWEGYKPKDNWGYDRRAHGPIKSFDRCSSKDVRPRDLAALCSTCDACEPVELELQRTHF